MGFSITDTLKDPPKSPLANPGVTVASLSSQLEASIADVEKYKSGLTASYNESVNKVKADYSTQYSSALTKLQAETKNELDSKVGAITSKLTSDYDNQVTSLQTDYAGKYSTIKSNFDAASQNLKVSSNLTPNVAVVTKNSYWLAGVFALILGYYYYKGKIKI